jgi:predicted acetyltransferase
MAGTRDLQTTAGIELAQATPGQEPILANLLELYCHDFSEFRQIDLGPDGRFSYANLPLYWSEPDRYPFLVRRDGELAGLVFVKRGSGLSGKDAVWDMAEFFVVRGQRRRGIGTAVAHQVWRQFPGLWEVRVMEANTAAGRFWRHAIAQFTGDSVDPVGVERDGENWLLFSFASPVTM